MKIRKHYNDKLVTFTITVKRDLSIGTVEKVISNSSCLSVCLLKNKSIAYK